MKLWIKVVLSVFIISVLVMAGIFGSIFYELSKINTTKISKTDENLGIKPQVPLKKEDVPQIINIALFGVDRRDVNEPSRSDSIIILSIDEVHKKIKMSSIMRDTYVQIKGNGKTKVNHAYAYGGPQLAIRTLNENFNLNIRNYVTVDFFKLEKIVDTIGGVTIDVKEDELTLVNSHMIDVAAIEKKSISQITKAGPQTLNGLQAVAYSRIRHDAGGDFGRTERQRTVLSALITKIQSLGMRKFPSLVSKLLPYAETSMNSMDTMKLGTKVFTQNIKILDKERFPVDGYCRGEMIGGVWYLVADMENTVDQFHKYIYEDIKPAHKAPLF